MKSIYLDNYRGFKNQVISLRDVNFCVGENSTGKTSFLAAVNLLSSTRFWFDQSFEGNEVQFKHFEDFVSVASKDKHAFHLGAVDTDEVSAGDSDASGGKSLGRAYLFRYIDSDGIPKLESFTTNYRNIAITVYISENAVRYRTNEFDLEMAALVDRHGELFSKWSKIQDNRALRGTRLVKDEGVRKGYVPPVYTIFTIVKELFTKTSPDGKRRFQVPPFPKPLLAEESAWIAPIRAKPRRTYDDPRLDFSPEGNHMPYVLKRMLAPGRSSKKFTAFLRKFGKESGLFKEVKVHKFGASSTSPFEIEIVLDQGSLNISNVGYGVAQGLPVIVEAFVRAPETTFVVQQPEVHLHPRAQASIGELIFNLALNDKKKFIVETHSDFMIDRFRIAKAGGKRGAPSSQVLFFSRKAGINCVSPILVKDDGELSSDQPEEYRQFFLNESIRALGI